MRFFLIGVVLNLTSPMLAAEALTLKTPRGAEVSVTVHRATETNRPVIVVAPGQSCNSLGPIFETLGQQGQARGYNVVRFEWAYCNSHPSAPKPSVDLSAEQEDFSTVLTFSRSLLGIDLHKIIIAGKSLGSSVGYKVFEAATDARALVLLTPLCSYSTDENGNPISPPKAVLDESYPKIRQESRPVLMVGGNQDSLCYPPILYSFLGDSKGNITAAFVGGGHSLTVKGTDGIVDQAKSQKNIDTAIGLVLNWADQL